MSLEDTFHIPTEPFPSSTVSENTPAGAPAETDAATEAEPEQLCREVMHLGDWLERHRQQKLVEPAEVTPLSTVRRLIGMQDDPRTYQDLIRRELSVVSGLFAPPAPHQHYDFFYSGKADDDMHEWVLHRWTRSQAAGWEAHTTWFVVTPRQAYHASRGEQYRPAEDSDHIRLHQAASRYYSQVHERLYR